MWLLHPPKSRLRWHLFTWLMAVPALVFVALVQVAGVKSDTASLLGTQSRATPTVLPRFSPTGSFLAAANNLPDKVVEYTHGWPCPWLQRAFGYHWIMWEHADSAAEYRDLHSGTQLVETPDDPKAISWMARQVWPGTAHASKLSWLGLLLNLLVSACVVAAPMVATEVWLRRRGGLWRFRIVDFLVAATAIGGLVGLWRWDQAAVKREHEIAASMRFETSPASQAERRMISHYVGPIFLSRLCGNDDLVPLFHRFIGLYVVPEFIDEIDYAKLSELEHLKTAHVAFRGWSDPMVPGYGLELLSQAPEINTLILTFDPAYKPYVPPSQYDQLDTIEHLSVDFPLSHDELLKFSALPRLRTLDVFTGQLTPEELADLRAAFAGVTVTSKEDPTAPVP